MLRTKVRRFSSAVLLEHCNGKLSKENNSLIYAASKISKDDLYGVIFTEKESKIEEEIQSIKGFKGLISVNCEAKSMTAENITFTLRNLQEIYHFKNWCASHSTTGKRIFPRLASIIGQSCVALSDVTGIEDERKFKRPIYAGIEINVNDKISCI
jgi:electron transfer flavoprotein alpha subunit